MRKNINTPAFGIKKFGYISDFKSSVAQFNQLLQGTGELVTSTQIDSFVDGVTPINLNSFGCDNHYNKPISDEFAAYRMIRTGRRIVRQKPQTQLLQGCHMDNKKGGEA